MPYLIDSDVLIDQREGHPRARALLSLDAQPTDPQAPPPMNPSNRQPTQPLTSNPRHPPPVTRHPPL